VWTELKSVGVYGGVAHVTGQITLRVDCTWLYTVDVW